MIAVIVEHASFAVLGYGAVASAMGGDLRWRPFAFGLMLAAAAREMVGDHTFAVVLGAASVLWVVVGRVEDDRR